MNTLTLQLLLISLSTSMYSQTKPIWDIGTRWVYEFNPTNQETAFVVNEIIDTINIDSMKLFVVDSYPNYTGIQYFYYDNSKVYNYDQNNNILKLLYDFGQTMPYQTKYKPICVPFFPYDSLSYQQYPVNIDSIYDFVMPDNTERQMLSVNITDMNFGTIRPRTILKDIGFMEGGTHYSHDWEIGDFICGESGNYTRNLRCFQNDSISYNFNDYPCDSIWFLTNTYELETNIDISIYPNPTHNTIRLAGDLTGLLFKLLDMTGKTIEQGEYSGQTLKTIPGLNILKVEQYGKVKSYKVINIGNSR